MSEAVKGALSIFNCKSETYAGLVICVHCWPEGAQGDTGIFAISLGALLKKAANFGGRAQQYVGLACPLPVSSRVNCLAAYL
jgi:hypothetical protein